MKRILFSAAVLALALVSQRASAADIPAPVYKAPPVAVWSWTGFYVGANIGGAWGNTTAYDRLATNAACWFSCDASWGSHVSGVTGGVQAGYNWQTSNIVFGVEAEVGYLGVNGTGGYPITGNTTFVDTNGGIFTTIRGRAGVAAGNGLFYVTGGYFGADFHSTVGTTAAAPVALINVSKTGFQNGWTAGGGVEWALGNSWSAKAEYLYYNVGQERVGGNFTGGGAVVQFFDIKNTGNIVRIGVNKKL